MQDDVTIALLLRNFPGVADENYQRWVEEQKAKAEPMSDEDRAEVARTIRAILDEREQLSALDRSA